MSRTAAIPATQAERGPPSGAFGRQVDHGRCRRRGRAGSLDRSRGHRPGGRDGRRRFDDRPAGGLGRDRGKDPAAERRRRLDRLERVGEVWHDAAELGELGVGLRARRQVLADRDHLAGVEGAQHEARGEVADLVAGQRRRRSWRSSRRPSRRVRSGPSPVRTRRSASSPSRIRLLTVPSGAPVRSAIPAGSARRSSPSSIASRWTSLSVPARSGPRPGRAARATSAQTSGRVRRPAGSALALGQLARRSTRRVASIARWWTIESSHVFTLPRPCS